MEIGRYQLRFGQITLQVTTNTSSHIDECKHSPESPKQLLLNREKETPKLKTIVAFEDQVLLYLSHP